MPLFPNDKQTLDLAAKALSDKELPKLAALIYESIQKGGFSAETLATFGKQFFAGIPWADIPAAVKLPLFKAALALGQDLSEVFETKEIVQTAPEAPKTPEPPIGVKVEAKLETKTPLIPEPGSNGEIVDSETGRPEGATEEEAPKAQA